MTNEKRYRVVASWSPYSGQWVLDCPQVDGVMATKRLDHVALTMANVITQRTGWDVTAEQIDVEYHVPGDAGEAVELVRRTRGHAEKALRMLARQRKLAVTELQGQAFSVRDIAMILNLTQSQVTQIATERPEVVV